MSAIWNRCYSSDEGSSDENLNNKPPPDQKRNFNQRNPRGRSTGGNRQQQPERRHERKLSIESQDGGTSRRGNNRRGGRFQNRVAHTGSQTNSRSQSRRGNRNESIHPREGNGNESIHPREGDRKGFAHSSKSKREVRPMPFTRMRELITKDSTEILMSIVDKDTGFLLALEEKEVRRDVMAYIFSALGKAVASHMRSNVNAVLNTVTTSENFFKKLATFLGSFQKCASQQFHLDALLGLTNFLHKFQLAMPSTATDPLIETLPLLERTIDMFLVENEESYLAASKNLQEIDERNKAILKGYSVTKMKQASRSEQLHLQTPPEDFRSIPVLPTVEDVRAPASFLRPNLVRGQYIDAEHYLDVQYRLLREDYVRPLRDGIAEYVALQKQGKSPKKCRSVKVYCDVRIVKQDFVNGGLVHIAFFDDKNFANIKWEYSKRFLTGSLLCLSSDHFETMLFASVARRDEKQLKKGMLLLRFEELTDEVLSLNHSRAFDVIETTSVYFEAYRHNLDALIQMNEKSFPMKPYIIEVRKNIERPKYLRSVYNYDLRPLLIPLNDKHVIHTLDEGGRPYSFYDFPSGVLMKAKDVQIFRDSQWPSHTELNLDPSQFSALKAAITKEFAVIQGPPGTGKTYVGLRIAQVLLHNRQYWHFGDNPSPMLVVCYTNHALDQFLEGLLCFTRRIVRVGGRGSNEAMAQYQLNNIRRTIEEKREVPVHIFRSLRQKKFELHRLKELVNSATRSVQNCYTSILTENVLRDVMKPLQYLLLQRVPAIYQGHPEDGRVMLDWLEIRGRLDLPTLDFTSTLKLEIPRKSEDDAVLRDCGDDEDISEGEADVEYIEAQRDINSDEFKDVSFEIPMPATETDEAGWQIQGNRKKQRQQDMHMISNYLSYIDAMTQNEVDLVKDNVWSLHVVHRWRLYKYWQERYVASLEKDVFELQQRLRKEFEEMKEMQTEIDLYVCQQAHVVGMTTTGAAKYRSIVQHLNPKIVIVEEAAEILESHVITSLAPDTQHLILIGDHQQLKPNPAVYALAVKFGLDVSLFERMVRNDMECYRLGIQHRMRPQIAELLVPHIYENLQNHESVESFEKIRGVSKDVFFVTHNFSESQEFDSKSKTNQHEAKFLVKLCRYLCLQGYDPSQITVLTTYSGQLFALKKLKQAESILKEVRFTVVDNFQGEENDIILISFVRSNVEGEIGFLKVSNRVCVALSRARKGLFCIGNFELLMKKCDLWKNIVDVLTRNQSIGPSLQLRCQNHPETSNIVSEEKDFSSVPEGGCTRPCEFRLPCGHVCPLTCHPYDAEHELTVCHSPCLKKNCAYGHVCKKECHMNCVPCVEPIDRILPSCRHKIKIKCHQRDDDVVCSFPCNRTLPCGHSCTNKCGDACLLNCEAKIDVISSVCGHNVQVQCSKASDPEYLMSKCDKPCNTKLSCEHICRGTCSGCLQGRLHVACNQKCKRILVCGHECKSPCAKTCPPCKRRCENRCGHSRCPQKCGEPCKKCREPCMWRCPHNECTRLCGELCDRDPCDEPCPNTLKCGHPCIGLCGELCPKECRACDAEKVTEIFFGLEDEADARFVRLEDCGHIVEITCLSQWMHQAGEGPKEIQMKTCPKCKMVVRRNLRFGNVVKACLADIEKVKKMTFGDVEQNKVSQGVLLEKAKLSNAKVFSFCEPMIKVLSGKCRSRPEITVMENVLNFACSLESVVEFLDGIHEEKEFVDDTVQSSIATLTGYMKSAKEMAIRFFQDEYLQASEQQLQDINWEIHRLKLADQFLRFLYPKISFSSNQHFVALVTCLVTYAPFRDDDEKLFTAEFRRLVELTGDSVLNISEVEKQTILMAMGLSKGHWYQCPNGHVYCITECGGAMQTATCNECGERIGGSSHALLSTNRVATAMDGARHSVWSEAANMENYRF